MPLIAHAAATPVAAGSIATTAPVDTTGASFIIAACTFETTRPCIPTDSKGNIYTALPKYTLTQTTLQFFYCKNATTGTNHTFTLTNGVAGTDPSIAIQAWSGISSLDVQNGATGGPSTQPVPTGSVTPTQDDEVLFSAMASINSATATIDSGFTITDFKPNVGAGFGIALAYLVQTTATAENPLWTGQGTAIQVANIAAFTAPPLVTLSLGSASGVPGGTVDIDLSIASTHGAAPTVVEFTISNDANVTLTGIVAGPAAAGKTFTNTGALCIIGGFDRSTIPDGVLATCSFLIAPAPSTTPITISITGVSISDSNADPIEDAEVSSLLTIGVPTIACPVSGGTATVGLAYFNNMVGSGGAPPYTYAVTGGSLPTGLSMNSAGLISGTPSAAGPFSWTTTITDSIGAQGTQVCGITVAAPLTPPSLCILVPADPYMPPLLLLNEPVEQVGT